jgi:hypothetical protein
MYSEEVNGNYSQCAWQATDHADGWEGRLADVDGEFRHAVATWGPIRPLQSFAAGAVRGSGKRPLSGAILAPRGRAENFEAGIPSR